MKFKSLQESFDTSSAIGRLMMNMIASFAEFELEVIRERVLAGMDKAKQQGTKSGKAIGRPATEVDSLVVLDTYNQTGCIREAARVAGCSSGKAWRIIKGVQGVQKGDGKVPLQNVACR